jgi:hypothetical protein
MVLTCYFFKIFNNISKIQKIIPFLIRGSVVGVVSVVTREASVVKFFASVVYERAKKSASVVKV